LYNILLTYFSDYYREVVLKEKLLPCIKEISGDNFIFQQDSAPAHRARGTVAQWHFYAERRQTLFLPTSGPQTAQI